MRYHFERKNNGFFSDESSLLLAWPLLFLFAVYVEAVVKELTKKLWGLVLLMMGLHVVVSVLLYGIVALLNINMKSGSAIAAIAAAFAVGQLYAHYQQAVMSSALRLRVVAIYGGFQLVLGFLALQTMQVSIEGSASLLIFGTVLLICAVAYFAIGQGGRILLKSRDNLLKKQ